ncbi:MAG: hypothetical protein ABRQ37_11095 [Candidatus Eremiobacterota bacterium]
MSKRCISLFFSIFLLASFLLGCYCDLYICFSDHHHHHHHDCKYDIEQNRYCANKDFLMEFKEQSVPVYLSRNIISEPQFEYL